MYRIDKESRIRDSYGGEEKAKDHERATKGTDADQK
jgi:hypothetical protein